MVALVTLIAACSDGASEPLIDGTFTPDEWSLIEQLAPLGPPPPDPTNRFADDARAAAFGQRLFFEKRFAGPLTSASDLGSIGDMGKVACVSCHDPTAWFIDTRPDNAVSRGAGVMKRNTPSLVDASLGTWFGWGGAHDVEWKVAASVIESPAVFNGNRLQFVHLIYARYRADYDALFPIALDPALAPDAIDAARFPAEGKPKAPGAPDGAWEMMTASDRQIVDTIVANCGKALEAYDRRLLSANAPLDRLVQGDPDALPPSAKRGLALFVGKAACITCHSGPTMSDQLFHDTAVAQDLEPLDLGRFDDLPRALTGEFNGAGAYSDDPVAGEAKLLGLVVTDELRGRFRTSPLRHVSMTGPYMHDGSIATLADVIAFYNDGGAHTGFPGLRDELMHPLNLAAAEAADLVAFLEQLTGDPVPAELTIDTSAP